MVNINTSKNLKDESEGNSEDYSKKMNTLIWTMRALDYINEENEENLSRVHVLCCSKCDFLTISLKILQQHMILQHAIPSTDFDNLTIYSCQECKCVSTELKLIQEHIKIFHNILTENSPLPEKVEKNTAILTPSLSRNNRKVPNIKKLVKTQLKISKKILLRKSLKTRVVSHFDNDTNGKTEKNCTVSKKGIAQFDGFSVDVNENDPLDMSVTSTTCPFKGVKFESVDSINYPFSTKQDAIINETLDHLSNTNNSLLTNPQTCIELIRLTLNQMLSKTTEQSSLSHIGFNSPSFLHPQFQLSQSIIPLLLPTDSQFNNGNNQTQPNPDLETIFANIQKQNLYKTTSSKSFDQNQQFMTFQTSPLYLNQNTGSATNTTKPLFVDTDKKNGNLHMSPLSIYNPKKSSKRSLKKQPAPTKIRNGNTDECGFLNPKFESPKTEPVNQENLFNRSFLDLGDLETNTDPVTLGKCLDEHDVSDSQINISSRSSPNVMSNDKPHRQNFTSQQNRTLSDWFFTHCDKPYPSTEDTKELSQLSGLTYSQVKKWFANKRARSSLNKKNHKNYCLVTPAESTMEDTGNNDLLSISPSSESHIDTQEAIDFTKPNQEDTVPQVE